MPTNPDGTLRDYNAEEIEAFNLRTRGVRDGTHPSEHYSPDGSGCERKWFCDWEQRFDVIKHLVGQVLVWDDSGTKKLTRTKPQTHPTFDQWYCTQARIGGHRFLENDTDGGDGNRMPRWEAAEIVAQYEQVPYRFIPDDEVTTERSRYVTSPGHIGADVTSSGSLLTLPGGIMQYKVSGGGAPDGKPIPYSVGMIEAEGMFAAIWHRIPEDYYQPGKPLFDRLHGDPVAGTRPWIGSSNSTAIFGRPAATCVLEGVEPKLRPDPIGSGYSWDLKFVWRYRAQTFFRIIFFDPTGAISPGYYVVMKAGAAYTAPASMADGDSLYYLRDHADGLFKIS